jgi:signal transduction histidine kinase
VSVGAGWAALALAQNAGLPLLAAACLAVIAFVAVTYALLACVLGILERVSPTRVFRERLVLPALFAATLGLSGGLVVRALWALDPLALVAFVPFALIAHRFGRLESAADRQLDAHREIASVSLSLVGCDLDEVVDRVLSTCGSHLLVGRATLRLDATAGDPGRAWTREFEGSALQDSGFVVLLPGARGTPIGELAVYPRRAMGNLSEEERERVRIVAGAAAGAIEHARALAALERANQDVLRAQAALSKQEKLSVLGTLVAGVAHEISNPLAFMKSNLELAAEDVQTLGEEPKAKDIQESITLALRGVGRLEELTRSLKGVARHGPSVSSPSAAGDCDLAAVTREVVAVIQAGLSRHIHLRIEIPPSPVYVRAQRGEVAQVALNLLKNAAEAVQGQERAEILVSIESAATEAKLLVRDNGPGISAEAQARLFTPFYTTKPEGTGLGLTLSRRIAEQAGGGLRFETAPGAGTTFTLTLPYRTNSHSIASDGIQTPWTTNVLNT